VINVVCNKRIGPGGGTRRLHQSLLKIIMGATQLRQALKEANFHSAWYHCKGSYK